LFREPGALLHGKLHRRVAYLLELASHDEECTSAGPYRASTASFSLSAWKCPISGSMTTSR
jgi:hypothetical protein